MGNTSSRKQQTKAKGAPRREPYAPREEPFAGRPNTAILLRAESTSGKLQILQDQLLRDADGEATTKKLEATSAIRTIDVYGEFDAEQLDLPGGLSILTVLPRMFFSRFRNVHAEKWRNQAHERADAFVYMIDMGGKSEEEYYGSNDGDQERRFHRLPWESDRYAISSFLGHPSVLKHPHKPFLLLVQKDNLSTEFDMERLINLLGLGRIRRPFRTTTYSIGPKNVDSSKTFMSSLTWIRAPSHEDGTALTECETLEDASIATTVTSTSGEAVVNSPNAYILDYEPTMLGGNPTLQRFEPVKRNSPCPFAKSAKLWGGKAVEDEENKAEPSKPVPYQKRVEHAALLNAGPLSEFVALVFEGEPLDGFCLEIPDARFETAEKLGEKVCTLLTKLAELDPSPGENAMQLGPFDTPQWRFRFAGEDFFVTTFSSRYPEDSSRQTFGVPACFMLFQPMTSFGRRGLKEDTPASATNWESPKTMRDKARVAFKDRGCPYFIPEELPYPVAEHIVKPIKDDGSKVIKWWEATPTITEEEEEEDN